MAAGKQLLPAISCRPNSFLEWLTVTGQIDTLFLKKNRFLAIPGPIRGVCGTPFEHVGTGAGSSCALIMEILFLDFSPDIFPA